VLKTFVAPPAPKVKVALPTPAKPAKAKKVTKPGRPQRPTPVKLFSSVPIKATRS
jgi:hypothetical protein